MKRLLVILSVLSGGTLASPSPEAGRDAMQTYKSAALTQCLRKAFPNEEAFNLDAMNSLSSLNSELKLPNELQSGREIVVLVEKFLDNPDRLPEKGKLPLKVLTCMNFFYSDELDALAKRYVKD